MAFLQCETTKNMQGIPFNINFLYFGKGPTAGGAWGIPNILLIQEYRIWALNFAEQIYFRKYRDLEIML